MVFYFTLCGLSGLSEGCNQYLSYLYSHCSIRRWRQRLFQEWIYQRRQVMLAMAFLTKQFFLRERTCSCQKLHHAVATRHRMRRQTSLTWGLSHQHSLCSLCQKVGIKFKVAWEISFMRSFMHEKYWHMSPEGLCPPPNTESEVLESHSLYSGWI